METESPPKQPWSGLAENGLSAEETKIIRALVLTEPAVELEKKNIHDKLRNCQTRLFLGLACRCFVR